MNRRRGYDFQSWADERESVVAHFMVGFAWGVLFMLIIEGLIV